MKVKQLLVFICLCVGLSPVYATHSDSSNRGRHSFIFSDYTPFSDRPIDVHYYVPISGKVKNMPIVFVFEGGDRDYTYLLDAWEKEAEKYGFVVVTPHFSLGQYPLSDYQEVGIMDRKHQRLTPRNEITPVLIDKMFESIVERLSSNQDGYMIYGHSAGGQFVQRFMLFHDSPYVKKAIIGCPGWYTMPNYDFKFPYGVANIPYVTEDRLKKYLSAPIVLQLATGDTIRESYLRKTPEAELQGNNRLERGRNFYQYLHQLAHDKHWVCNWRLVEEENIGHSSVPMGQKAAALLMEDSVRVLFIGNSYTFFNNLSGQVKLLGQSCGKNIATKQEAHGGWKLSQHASSSQTFAAIQEGDWDYVVYQEQSLIPTYDNHFIEKNMYPAITTLDSLRSLYSPKSKSVFYMTWGRNNMSFETMQHKLSKTYLDLSKRFDAICAPIGIAWKRVRTERPDLKLYVDDQSHPSQIGSYLAACVFYAILCNEPFDSNYYGGLSEEDAKYLQCIAQEVVFGNKVLWRLQSKTQPDEVTDLFYPESEIPDKTPTFFKSEEEGLASLFDIKKYFQDLAVKFPKLLKLKELGKTSNNRVIDAVYFGDSHNADLKIWIQACLHGNEPAGAESICLLADYLLNTKAGNNILKKISLVIIPVANPDGYALQQRFSGSGLDLNRDQSKLNDSVSLLLKKEFAVYSPDISLDIHEYNPIRSSLFKFCNRPVSMYEDVLFLSCGHLNIPANLREISNRLFVKSAADSLSNNGYSFGEYYSCKVEGDTLFALYNGKNPQSSSTFHGLANTISLFVEIRGIGLERKCLKRRSECGFLVARSVLETAIRYKSYIRKELKKAYKQTMKGKENIVVLADSKPSFSILSLIDLINNKPFMYECPSFNALNLCPVLVRKRPKAYILSPDCHLAVEKLKMFGIEVKEIEETIYIDAEIFLVTDAKRSLREWEKIFPVEVQTKMKKNKIKVVKGSFFVSVRQKLGNLLVTLLEPESINGFVHFDVIPAKLGHKLPFVRLM